MSSESDTPNIDDLKKTIAPSSTYMNKLKKMITAIIQMITHLFIYAILAGYVIYSCKVAQSNLFPTETACKPYTNVEPTVQPIKTNIFETLGSTPQLSQKLYFPYEKNDRNIVLDAIRQIKENPNMGNFGGYIMSIIQGGLSLNFVFFDVFFNLLNQLPEILIAIIGPPLLLFFLAIVVLIDGIYILISWFTQLSWFFKKNENKSLSGVPQWSNITFLEPFEFFFAIGISFFFAVLGLFLLPILMPILSIVFIILTLFSLNVYRGILNGNEVGMFSIIKQFFINYKVIITSIIALIVIIESYTILGPTAGIFCVLTILLIYFNVIKLSLFDSIPEKYLSPMVSSEKANKKRKGSHPLLLILSSFLKFTKLYDSALSTFVFSDETDASLSALKFRFLL
jgi:hypothetical protein